MDCNTFESTYGRRYPLEHNEYPYPSHQQQWQPHYQPWNSHYQGNTSLDFNYHQPYSCNPSPMFHELQAGNYISEPCNPYSPMSHDQPYSFPYYYDESSNMFYEKHAGGYINEHCHPNFSSDFNQTPPQDEEAELKDLLDATQEAMQDSIKSFEILLHDSVKRVGEQISMLAKAVEEYCISQSVPCEKKEEFQQEEKSCESEVEVESMAETIEEGKYEVAIEQSEEFPTEKPVETRVEVEDKTEIGYSNFEIEEFVIPPYEPSHHLELKIFLGQEKGEKRWLIQLQIYFLEATKRKETILSSTPKFFMFSMKNCKGMKFLMHGWHNFPFDPGGVELWSG